MCFKGSVWKRSAVGVVLAVGVILGAAGCSKRMMTERQYTLMQEDLAEDKDFRAYLVKVCMSDLKAGKIPQANRGAFAKLAGAAQTADDKELCARFVAGVSRGAISYGKMYAAGFTFTFERKK